MPGMSVCVRLTCRVLLSSRRYAPAFGLTLVAGLLAPPESSAQPQASASLSQSSARMDGLGGQTSWNCYGYAASSAPWATAQAELRLRVGPTVIAGHVFSANVWGAQYQVGGNVAPAGYDRTITCEINVSDESGSTSAGDQAPIPADCGDDRTAIIAEYTTHNVSWKPTCADFASSGGSAHFSWNELNGGFADGNPHASWGIVRAGLTTGLESTRTNYNRGGIRLSSGYRCPHGNANVGGVSNSLHMHGRAADMYSTDHEWTEDEFNLLKAAADATGPAESLFWHSYSDRHYHAAW